VVDAVAASTRPQVRDLPMCVPIIVDCETIEGRIVALLPRSARW
jgi:hypothetical protein